MAIYMEIKTLLRGRSIMNEFNKSLTEWFSELFTKWAGALGVMAIAAMVGWAGNVSYSLWSLTIQGEKINELLIKVEKIAAVESRVSIIEQTRFKAIRGEALEKQVSSIEWEIKRLKEDLLKIQEDIKYIKQSK